MEVTGQITKVLPLQTGAKKDGSGDWQKQSFVLKTADEYNNLYCFEIFGDEKVNNFKQYNKEGDTVKVDFNVQTNEYQGKYYTTLQAWKIYKADAPAQKPTHQFEPAPNFTDEDKDDMPF